MIRCPPYRRNRRRLKPMAIMHDERRPVLGWCGFAAGAGALILALVAFSAGPFAPQPTAGAVLGEFAVDLVQSATRSVAGGERPAPAAPTRTVDDYLGIAIAILAGGAVVLGLAGLVRREPRDTAVSGVALGAIVVGFQLFTYTVGLIVGAIVIVGTIYALRDTLGDIFGGIFGG